MHGCLENRRMTSDEVITKVYAEEVITSFREQMRETERLAEELNDLLKNYGATLESEGIREQAETLMCWTECYRHGLVAADKIFQNGNLLLLNLEKRLQPATAA